MNPKALEKKGVFVELREAEARHLPVHLKQTLEQDEAWEKVSIVPGDAPVDLMVGGKILASDGVKLGLQIRAVDASGTIWLDKKYRARVDRKFYEFSEEDDIDAISESFEERREPFQPLYDRIAADLLKAKQQRSQRELWELRWITRLRLADELAPMFFGGFLEAPKKGNLSLARLPAEGDPMLALIERIEVAHQEFLDTVTLHQVAFSHQILELYDIWQLMSFDNWRNMQEHRTSKVQIADTSWDPGSVGPGSHGPTAGIKRRDTDSIIMSAGVTEAVVEYARIRKEIGTQLSADVEPMLIEVEGQTLRLQGTLETQYATWQRLLRQIFAETTGF